MATTLNSLQSSSSIPAIIQTSQSCPCHQLPVYVGECAHKQWSPSPYLPSLVPRLSPHVNEKSNCFFILQAMQSWVGPGTRLILACYCRVYEDRNEKRHRGGTAGGLGGDRGRKGRREKQWREERRVDGCVAVTIATMNYSLTSHVKACTPAIISCYGNKVLLVAD